MEWILLFLSREECPMESRLKKYVSSLSEEERALYKPLIDDALRREEALSAASAEAKAQAETYCRQMERLRETTLRFQAGVARLNRKLSELAELPERAARAQAGGAALMGGEMPRYRH
jgi:hypothetical protein